MSAQWKATERRVAALFGGKRIGHLGGADVDGGWCSVECKHRKTLPAWLTSAWTQAHRHSLPGQLPIVVLHQHGERHADDLVVVKLSDFTEWFGPTAED